MKLYAEHFPKPGNSNKALCGQGNKPIILDLYRDNDPDMYCRKCKKIACPDCHGMGFMGGKSFGIYCPCKYGAIEESKDLQGFP